MALGIRSGCINHPGVEAEARCKQCGKPVCGTCRIDGPTGTFCSDLCREKHEQFIQRAQALDKIHPTVGLVSKLTRLVVKLLVLAAVVLLCALGATYLGFNVPVLSDWFRNLFNM